MMRFAADENFNNDILRGLLRKHPELDIVRAQDTRIYGAEDPAVLEWTAEEGRILLTHDIRTMPDFAYERVREGRYMPGVFVISDDTPIGPVIDYLLIIIGASDTEEWENRVFFLAV